MDDRMLPVSQVLQSLNDLEVSENIFIDWFNRYINRSVINYHPRVFLKCQIGQNNRNPNTN